MARPSRTPKKTPFDMGKRAADMDEVLPWDEIIEEVILF